MVPERAPRARMLRLALGVAALTGRSSAFLIAPALSRPTTHAPHTLMCDGSGTHGGHRQTHADEGEATPLEEVKVVGFSELGALDLTPATLADPDTPPQTLQPILRLPHRIRRRIRRLALPRSPTRSARATRLARRRRMEEASRPSAGASPPPSSEHSHPSATSCSISNLSVCSSNLTTSTRYRTCRTAATGTRSWSSSAAARLTSGCTRVRSSSYTSPRSSSRRMFSLMNSCRTSIRRHTPFSPYVAPRFPHMSEINALFSFFYSPKHPLSPICRPPFPPYVRN